MVLVELFDSEPIENIAGFITTKPRQVIFIGEKKKIERFEKVFRRVADERGLSTEFDSRAVNRNYLQNMVEVLEGIVKEISENNPREEIVFDLCGGDDLMLVAAGIVYKSHQDTVQLQRYNVYTNKLIDCDEHVVMDCDEDIVVPIEEFMMIHGGCVVHSEYNSKSNTRWKNSPELKEDAIKMWEICAKNSRDWNRNVGITARFASKASSADLNAYVNLSGERKDIKNSYNAFLKKLLKAGVVENVKTEGNLYTFSFKNKKIKQCLTKEGVLLELYVTLIAENVQEDGRDVYDDVMMGVKIDWDGVIGETPGHEVENEIDVILMRGMRPVFISCKNGNFFQEELFKLSAVAEKFGGKYVQKVLITNYLSSRDNPLRKENRNTYDGEENSNSLKKKLLWNRAIELNIKIICREAIQNESLTTETIRNLYK